MWKSATAASALVLAMTTTAPLLGQTPAMPPAQLPAGVAPGGPDAPPRPAFEAGTALPEPVPYDKLQAPAAPVPHEPIEPYLLTRGNGPFMVMAHTFMGPEATNYAVALAKELRQKEHLPAYVWNQKVHPGLSNIRDVPPTSDNHIVGGEKAQAHYRNHDEAVVLVGDCKSIDEAMKLRHQVMKLHPASLGNVPHLFLHRANQGLSRATITTNPYRAAQELYPGKKEFDPYAAVVDFQAQRKPVDKLIVKMNDCPRSVFKCPAPYTLVVAEFSGQSQTVASTANIAETRPTGRGFYVSEKQSKLVSASVDAQKLADVLAKNDDIKRAGYEPYVFHDLRSSKVTLGAFQKLDDPSAQALREFVLKKVQVRSGNKVPVPDGKGGKKYVEDITFLTPSATLMEVPRP